LTSTFANGHPAETTETKLFYDEIVFGQEAQILPLFLVEIKPHFVEILQELRGESVSRPRVITGVIELVDSK